MIAARVTRSLLCRLWNEQGALPGFGGLVSPAEARIGRPLTPFSVTGVARRTVRRCAVSMYYC
ncbi:hypothetical protein NKH36_09705 [Mesorhizobium sp. M1312]|uniref:hypothetical protein n=1 Tax=unclassified Mesorhizobium TaxID=325217 RepID=UPI003334D1BF